MTKILLDCVVTAADPNKCSSNIQYLTFVKRTLDTREDVFFYWLIPDWITDADFSATYPQDDRVKYFRVPQHKDRTKEYLTLGKALDHAVAFNGGLWDFDVLLTMRTGLVPMLKMLATSPRSFKQSWMKQVWLLELMVLMEFKKTVLTFEQVTQDMFTLAGYLAADRAYIDSQVDKPCIARRARELLAPSQAIKVAQKLTVTGYATSTETSLKDPSQFPDPAGGKPFCIAHAGRMEKANRIAMINDVMVKHFVMKGSKVKLLVCTVSSGPKVFDTSVVDVQMASREEFWKLCKSEMHVVINMSEEGGSGMSLLEPMMMGVPAICGPRKFAEKSFGKDYPFLANSEVEAYGLVQAFYEDYAGMYAKWAAWHQTKFQDLVKERYDVASIYTLLDKDVEDFAAVDQRIRDETPGWRDNQMTLDVLAHVCDATEFVLSDVVSEMVAAKKMDKKMLDKLSGDDRDSRGLVWSTDFNKLRRVLSAFYGWTDASTKVGHLKRAV